MPLLQRVVLAHHARQRCHLCHHLRRQIRAAEPRCGPGGADRALIRPANGPRDVRHQRHGAHDFVMHVAQLLLECGAFQLGQVVLQAVLQVFLVKELGIFEARLKHRLIACAHRAVIDRAIRDGHERAQQLWRWRRCCSAALRLRVVLAAAQFYRGLRAAGACAIAAAR